MNPRPGLLACAIVAGCFRPTGSTDTSNPTISTGLPSTDDTGTDTATSDTGWDSTAATVSMSSTTDDPSTTTAAGGCGDGSLDPQSEECDDGNQEGGDGCSTICTKEFRRVFVTSQVWSGNLGGLEGADQKCQDAADAAGLPGVYRAWLSTTTVSPEERFVHSVVPYKQLDGVEVASDWNDLTDGDLKAGIVVSELKGPAGKGVHSCMPVDIAPVWTGTGEAGLMIPGDYFCGDWNSTEGEGFSARAGSTDSQWTQFCISTCQDQAALYCFEQ